MPKTWIIKRKSGVCKKIEHVTSVSYQNKANFIKVQLHDVFKYPHRTCIYICKLTAWDRRHVTFFGKYFYPRIERNYMDNELHVMKIVVLFRFVDFLFSYHNNVCYSKWHNFGEIHIKLINPSSKVSLFDNSVKIMKKDIFFWSIWNVTNKY